MPLYIIISTILLSAIGFAFFGVWSVFVVMGFVILLVLTPNLFVTFLIFTCFLPYIGAPDIHFLRHFTDIWFYFYAALAASWIHHVFTHPQRIYFHIPLTLLFFSYLLVCLLSLFGSFDLSTAEPFFMNFQTYRRVLEPLLSCSLLLLSMSAFEKEYQLEKVFWVIVLTGIPLAITIFFIGEFAYFWHGPPIDPVGIFIGQHIAASHMMFCTIMAFFLYRCTSSRKNRYILLACCALFLYVEILIVSRTILTSLLLIVLLSPLLDGKFKKSFSLLVGFVVVLFVLYPFLPRIFHTAIMTVFHFLLGDVSTSIVASNFAAEDIQSPGTRISDIKLGLSLAARNPLLGVGIGKNMWIEEVLYRNPPMLHNYFINILVETGLIGLSIVLAIILLTLLMAFRSLAYFRQVNNYKMYSLTKGLLLSIVAILIVFLYMPGFAEGERTIFVLFGLIAIVDRLRERHKKQTDKENQYYKFLETDVKYTSHKKN